MERAWLKRGLSASLSVVLAATLAGVAPAAAFASDQSEADRWAEAIEEQVADKSIQTYAYSDGAIALTAENDSSSDSLAAGDWYSLLDPNKTNSGILDANGKMYPATSDSVVTPVKFQNPWGTCWGFSIIAACETSILSDLGTTYSATNLDLSELQLVGSVYRNGGVPEDVSSTQAGEGYHNTSADPNAAFNMGGFMNYGATAFASGMGPVKELDVPYRNSGLLDSEDDAPIIECIVTYNEKDDQGNYKSAQEHLTEAEIAAKEADTENVKSVVKRYYAGNYTAMSEDGQSATTYYTDWTVDDKWYTTAYNNLEDSNILPETRVLSSDGKYQSTDLKAVKAIQSELKAGRAVSVAFCADTSMPGQDTSKTQYINTNWAHYTCDDVSLNHAVTIVGYDNDYDASNFAKDFDDTAAHTPEGNGAWLVKNSWGSETQDFPNNYTWGMEDTDGNNSGYFWLSYYDKSVTLFESFDFDVNDYSDNTEYYVDQYDYLPEIASYSVPSVNPTSSANIFTVESQESDSQGYNSIAVRTLSCATYKPNTAVTYKVYVLDDEAVSPTDPAHSKLVYESEPITYTYGGYHRTTLDESDWINLRDGQRYAVVTTQRCLDDDLYYQGVAYNRAKATDAEVAAYEKLVREQVTSQYRELIEPIAESMIKSEHPEWSEEQVKEKVEEAVEAFLKLMQTTIDKTVESSVDTYANTYLTSVVNKGESWTGIASDDGSITWSDWTVVTSAAKTAAKTEQNLNIVADNAPVKAFAELTNYASVAELNSLSDAIAAAKAALESLKISADGTDVSADDQWITQEQYDSLKAALATAEAMLEDAGDYTNQLSTIAAGTPDSDDVLSMAAKLAVNSQPGTKVVPAADNNSSKATKGNGTYAKTGDAATSAAAAIACVATIAGAAAIAARRRQRD